MTFNRFERRVTQGMSIISMKDISKQICPLCGKLNPVAWQYVTCQCKDKVHKTCLACIMLVGCNFEDNECYKEKVLSLLKIKKGGD
jgi:hypothetical protein